MLFVSVIAVCKLLGAVNVAAALPPTPNRQLAAQIQDGTWLRPTPFDFRTLGIEFVTLGDGHTERIAAVDFPAGVLGLVEAERVPLARPVSDLELALLGDNTICMLAGGLAEDLDIYRFDPSTRSVERIEAPGGRRLPARFGEGLGSWPLYSGRAFAMFAFEKDERVEFRAAAKGHSFASRTLDLECSGFSAELDAPAFAVRVRFTGARRRPLDDFEFVSPGAPRLAIDGGAAGVLACEPFPPRGSAKAELTLRNSGGAELQLEAELLGPFRCDELAETSIRIGPGGERKLTFVCGSDVPGLLEGLLRLRSEVAGAAAEVVLRAQCAVPVAIEAPPVASSAVPEGVPVDRSPTRPGTDRAPVPRRLAPAPAAVVAPRIPLEDLVGFDADWRGEGSARVTVQVRQQGVVREKLWIRNLRTGDPKPVPLDAQGRAIAVMSVAPLDPIAVADSRDGEFQVVGVVPPGLRLSSDGYAIHVHAQPDRMFLIVQVVPGTEGLRLVGSGPRWSGRVDARGLATVDTALIRGADDPVHLVVVIRGRDGRAVVSAPIEIGPSSPGSGSDRAK